MSSTRPPAENGTTPTSSYATCGRCRCGSTSATDPQVRPTVTPPAGWRRTGCGTQDRALCRWRSTPRRPASSSRWPGLLRRAPPGKGGREPPARAPGPPGPPRPEGARLVAWRWRRRACPAAADRGARPGGRTSPSSSPPAPSPPPRCWDVPQGVVTSSPSGCAGAARSWTTGPVAALFVERTLANLSAARPAACGWPCSARMTQASRARGRAPATARALLGAFDLVLPQDTATEMRLSGLGADTGPQLNLKLVGEAPPVDAGLVATLKAGAHGRRIVLAASTHPGEEPLIAQAFRAATADGPGALLIVAPRHPDRGAQVAADLAAAGFTVARRAAGEALTATTTPGGRHAWRAWRLLRGRRRRDGRQVRGRSGHNPPEAARLEAPSSLDPRSSTRGYAEMLAEAAIIRPSTAQRLPATSGPAGQSCDRAAHRWAAGAMPDRARRWRRRWRSSNPVGRRNLHAPLVVHARGHEPAAAWPHPLPADPCLVDLAVTARRSRGPPTDGVPVICVGNLTMGGVGKTPVVRLAERLAARVVHLLSRGYGRRLEGPVRVDPAVHNAPTWATSPDAGADYRSG